jgi:uncharacterized protein with PIN domain
MAYRIPSDERVERALKKIFEKYRTVSSQSRLKELVDKELKRYRVSPPRIRKITISSNVAEIEIHSREGDPDKILTRCPVCTSSLKRLKNLTVWGGEVTIEFRCNRCGYWTGKKKRIPTLYVFHKK